MIRKFEQILKNSYYLNIIIVSSFKDEKEHKLDIAMKLLKITFLFYISILNCNNGINAIQEFWVQKTNEDNLYAVIYLNPGENIENENISAWNNFIKKSHYYLKKFDIQVGFVDCNFLSQYPADYEKKFHGKDCPGKSRVDNKILFFE